MPEFVSLRRTTGRPRSTGSIRHAGDSKRSAVPLWEWEPMAWYTCMDPGALRGS